MEEQVEKKTIESTHRLIDLIFSENPLQEDEALMLFIDNGKPKCNVVKKRDDESVIKSIQKLYLDIDKCISDLIRSRIRKDEFGEAQSMFRMESLMVWTLQELSYLHEYLKAE